MIRYLTSLLIAILITTSVVSSACALETMDCCCGITADTVNSISASLNQLTNREVIQNDCCCVPVPSNKLPNTAVKIKAVSLNVDIPVPSFIKLFTNKPFEVKLSIDERKPLHLASNKIYLKKRVLLI